MYEFVCSYSTGYWWWAPSRCPDNWSLCSVGFVTGQYKRTLFQHLSLPFPVSKSHASSQREEALLENVTRLGEHSETLQKSLSQLPSQNDLLENIWKLESLFHNHSEQLQLLGNICKAEESRKLFIPNW